MVILPEFLRKIYLRQCAKAAWCGVGGGPHIFEPPEQEIKYKLAAALCPLGARLNGAECSFCRLLGQ